MSTKPIPLAIPDLGGREGDYLAACVRDNWVSSAGPHVGEMEARMAALCGRRHAVATVNGTTALHLALLVAGVGAGDMVVVPDFTFAATANAVAHAGATPLFVDVTEESWTLDPALLAAALAEPGARVRAILAVHALGHPADMDAIARIAAPLGIPVIEDAAGAIGARYKGRSVGALGAAAIFSFNGNKTVTAGGGGMIVTDNEAWAERARSLSTQAREGRTYRHNEIGFNYRMTNVNAALGLAQLERLDDMVAAKRTLAARYDAAFAGRADMRPMPRAAWVESGCWLYSLRCATRADAADLIATLAARDIEARTFWEGLAGQAPWRDCPRRLAGVSEALSGTVVSLPCSSHLTAAEQQRVIDAVAGWHGGAVTETRTAEIA